MPDTQSERGLRYRDILPEDLLQATDTTVVGCGAIGRQVALQLAAMGIGSLTLVDFDTVDERNLGPQGWCPADIDKPKVEVLGAQCSAINPDLNIRSINSRVINKMVETGVVFACADSMEVRSNISAWFKGDLLVDGRMGLETMRILAFETDLIDFYRATLFPDSEGEDLPCTMKATGYCAQIAAGLMVTAMAQWLKGNGPIAWDRIFCLPSGDWIVDDPSYQDVMRVRDPGSLSEMEDSTDVMVEAITDLGDPAADPALELTAF